MTEQPELEPEAQEESGEGVPDESLEGATEQPGAAESEGDKDRGGDDGDSSSPEDFKPPASDLIVRDRGDVYRVMDRADGELILKEMQGQLLETMLYSFEQGGKLLTDLSYTGINHLVGLINRRGGMHLRISDKDPLVHEYQEGDETYIRVMVYAEDEVAGDGRWGAATEPVHMKRGKKLVWDKFAFTKALSKAQRNALKSMIPEDTRQAMIGTFLKEPEHVRKLQSAAGATKAEVEELPAALTDERAEKQQTEIHKLYDELRKLNPVVLTPKLFHEYLSRAEHDHARMDDYIAFLRTQILEESEKAAEKAKGDEE